MFSPLSPDVVVLDDFNFFPGWKTPGRFYPKIFTKHLAKRRSFYIIRGFLDVCLPTTLCSLSQSPLPAFFLRKKLTLHNLLPLLLLFNNLYKGYKTKKLISKLSDV
jgi:hypothetical protein